MRDVERYRHYHWTPPKDVAEPQDVVIVGNIGNGVYRAMDELGTIHIVYDHELSGPERTENRPVREYQGPSRVARVGPPVGRSGNGGEREEGDDAANRRGVTGRHK